MSVWKKWWFWFVILILISLPVLYYNVINPFIKEMQFKSDLPLPDEYYEKCHSKGVNITSACINGSTISVKVLNVADVDFLALTFRLYASQSEIHIVNLEGVGLKSYEAKSISNISWQGEINNVKRIEIVPTAEVRGKPYPCTYASYRFPPPPAKLNYETEPLPNC